MFVLCSLALLERFIELHSGAARQDDGSAARSIPRFEFW
jgi:hypothetical protein